MSPIILCLIALVLGYALGNIPFAYLISKHKYQDDIRTHGSGNAGSTNMLRTYGLKAALLTFGGDLVKAIAAVLLGRLIGGEYAACAAALGVVLGHNFPAVLQFRGGKGVASTLGAILVLTPIHCLVALAVAVVVLLISKTVSLMSLCGITVYLILVAVFLWGSWPVVILAFLLWLLIVIRHRDNIRRLLRGEEPKTSIGGKSGGK